MVDADIEDKGFSYAAEHIVPEHLRREAKTGELVDKTRSAVKERLTKEINYWDHWAHELKELELAGRVNARINSAKARQRADELESRSRGGWSS
jgi:predicted transcriptional regulator